MSISHLFHARPDHAQACAARGVSKLAMAGVLCLALPVHAQQAPPIVTDRDFAAALPPLDAAVPAPTAPPAPAQAPAQADPVLDQPLPSIETFAAQPLRDDPAAAIGAATGKVAQLRYRWAVVGLDQLRDQDPIAPIDGHALVATFSGVSALQEGKGRAANGAMIQARIDNDEKALVEVLSSQGYHDAVVQSGVAMPEAGKPGDITVTLTVAPGQRYHLASVATTGPTTTPADLVARNFVLRAGDPLVAERVLSAEAGLGVALPQSGYPFVKVGQRDILLDAETGKADYTLPVDPGPLSRFGDISVKSGGGGKKKARAKVFTPAHIATIARFKKGEIYDSRKIDDLRKALVATNLFATVTVEPVPSGQPTGAGDESQYANLVVNQRPGPARSLTASAGYSTGQGIKAVGGWSHANLFPPEGALLVNATGGTNEQGLSTTFRRSNAGRRDRTVELSLSADHSNLNAYEALTAGLKGRISVASTPIWQKRWTYSYGFELLASNEKDYDFVSASERRRTFSILALPGQITYDRSDSLLDPTRGYRLSATLSPEASLGSGGQTYARAIIEGTAYWPLTSAMVLAGRLRLGAIGGASREGIAPSRRFYSGGGGSVRGFGYQELGPKDPNGNPIGGRSQAETSVEMRYRFGNFGVVGFVDSGQVFTSELPTFSSWRFGTGVGFRYYTNFGPMRFDIATPINRKVGESRIAVYASIGQAF